MLRLLACHPIRVLSVPVVAVGLAIAACATVENPAAPSETTFPILTITADGISQNVPFLVPGSPIRIVNNDTKPHRIHLDTGIEQPGCGAIENSGELAPGESRVTAPLGLDVAGCAVHDHMSHGDARFAVRLNVDDIE